MPIATAGVHRVLGGLLLFRAVELGNDDGCARGKPYKKADKQIDERTRRAADGRKRLLADEFAHDGRVHGVVELLEKGAEQDGEENSRSCFQITPSTMLLCFSVRLSIADAVRFPPALNLALSHRRIYHADYSTRFFKMQCANHISCIAFPSIFWKKR